MIGDFFFGVRILPGYTKLMSWLLAIFNGSVLVYIAGQKTELPALAILAAAGLVTVIIFFVIIVVLVRRLEGN